MSRLYLPALAMLTAVGVAAILTRDTPTPAGTSAHANTAPATEPADGVPDLGFDYRALVREQFQLVADGKGDKAIELLEKHALGPDTFNDASRDVFRKKYATMFGAGGKYLGVELVGFKRLGSRFVKLFAVTYFERSVITTTYLFVRNPEDRWRISTLTMADGVELIEATFPLTPFPAARD